MAFKKGQSGNPTGRRKGAKNKVNNHLRLLISGLIEDNFEKVQEDFKKLRSASRIKAFVDLLPFVLPKLQNISIDQLKLMLQGDPENPINIKNSGYDISKLTDEELETIIRLQNKMKQ